MAKVKFRDIPRKLSNIQAQNCGISYCEPKPVTIKGMVGRVFCSYDGPELIYICKEINTLFEIPDNQIVMAEPPKTVLCEFLLGYENVYALKCLFMGKEAVTLFCGRMDFYKGQPYYANGEVVFVVWNEHIEQHAEIFTRKLQTA